jgi:tetratricopeptide (TPR) repeat protein
MFDYPNASTILSGWDSDIGCKINSTWLLWAHRLVSSKRDSITTLTFPFDKDKDIDILENEALVYFAQLEEYPNLTKDMAQYIIASMLIKKGDISDAILELEDLISTAEISSIRAFDYEAANKPYGYLLGCELPHDMVPIWRVQYDATIKLIELYRIEDNTDKALQLSLELANKSSPDGWYWNINRYAGDICLKMGKYGLAAEQYELSLAGINRMIAIQSDRYERLYEQGNVVKHANFSSWEEEAANLHFGTIKEIEDLLSQARNH